MNEITGYATPRNFFGSAMKLSGPKWILGLTILFTYTLMIFGNIVTTTGSGLACPDWPLCYGTVNPPKELSIWIEWSHRLLGGITGFLILVSTVYMWKRADRAMKFFIRLALGLVVVAATLGGAVVLSEAPMLDSVWQIALVSSHIVLATVIFTSMILAFKAVSTPRSTDNKSYALWLFGIVYFQVILGIIVRYSGATLACPDFPLCQGSLLPPGTSPEVLLHYFHRLVALSIFCLTLWRLITAFRAGGENMVAASITFALILLQASFGIAIVLTQMFLPVVVMHGATGFLLLGWVAYLGAPHIVPGAAVEGVSQ